jgi:GNAT superfamily N-acetyltransferase
MAVTQWDKDDQAVFDGCLAVDRAAWQADDPDGPPRSARKLRVQLTGVAGGDTETWCELDGAKVRGWYRLYLSSLENLDVGDLELVVDPGQRRLGLGMELLRHAAGRAAQQGRSRLLGEPLQTSGVAEFAEAAGARAGWLRPGGFSTSPRSRRAVSPDCERAPHRPRPDIRWSLGKERCPTAISTDLPTSARR